jgi:hypothetical protein
LERGRDTKNNLEKDEEMTVEEAVRRKASKSVCQFDSSIGKENNLEEGGHALLR